jgi:CheY-like chemotaxis protein
MSATVNARTQYLPGQLLSVLEGMRHQGTSGTVYFTANLGVKTHDRSRVLVFRNGEIVYGGARRPSDNLSFVTSLGKKLNRDLVERAVNFAASRLINKNSIRELLELTVRLHALKWTEIENLIFDSAVQAIEQISPYGGQFWLEQGTDRDIAFDLTPTETGKGLEWSRLRQDIDRRHQIWQSLAPQIPSIEVIPQLNVKQVGNILDTSFRRHLEEVKGRCSLTESRNCTLIEISEELDRDPLELAKSYLMWVEAGWMTCQPVGSTRNLTEEQVNISTHKQGESDTSAPPVISSAVVGSKRPLILSVDDSMIVQTSIKRILSDRYEVMLANNAIAALNILNANAVEVLLLDVTMPDIDGLEFCKTLRGIPKFKNLPIIMLTAKDSLVDKCQGFIAGSNQYLYKPVEPAQLLEVVGSYILS